MKYRVVEGQEADEMSANVKNSEASMAARSCSSLVTIFTLASALCGMASEVRAVDEFSRRN